MIGGWIRRIQDIKILAGELEADTLPVVAGTIEADQWITEMDRYQNLRPAKAPIWHCHITADSGPLTADECKTVAQLMEYQQKYEGYPWIALDDREGGLHIIVCRVRDTGNLWRPEHATWRVRDVARKMETRKRNGDLK